MTTIVWVRLVSIYLKSSLQLGPHFVHSSSCQDNGRSVVFLLELGYEIETNNWNVCYFRFHWLEHIDFSDMIMKYIFFTIV